MTRSELITRLTSCYHQLTQEDAELAVAEILNAIQTTLSQGNRVEIRGFGTFTVNYRPARIGRNPKTGESVSVPDKWYPHFKADKPLRERVDRLPMQPTYSPA